MGGTYSLLFEGLVAEGKTVVEVKTNLRALFGLSEEKAESLFRPGVRMRIRKGLDYDAAVAAKAAFERSGALCRLVPDRATRTVKSAPPAPASASPASAPAQQSPLTAPRTFYFLRRLRLILCLAPAMLLVFPALLPFKLSDMPVEGVAVLTSMYLLVLLAAAHSVWRLWQPLLILSAEGVEQRYSRLFRSEFACWDTIQGMTVVARTYRGKAQKTVKLIIGSGGEDSREWLLGISTLEDGEEALALLRQRIPEKKAQDLSRALERLRPLQTEAIRYRDIEVSRAGITRNGETIPWERVTRLSTEGMVIAGYGSVAVGYDGGRKPLIVRAATSEAYLQCVQLILALARNAAIDPGIVKMLEYPVPAAKKDNFVVLLLVAGIPLGLGALIALTFYPPTVASTWLYPLLLLPLVGAPFAWTLKLLVNRFQGGAAGSSRKLAAAGLFNLGIVLSVALLFSLSPASFVWLLADAATLTGRMEQAETLYLEAEPALGANEDFIFTMGQFYARKGDWNKAAEYYIRSYTKDPTNWMAEPLAKIPEALIKAGRDEEALQWCERIMGRYVDNRQVTRLLERKKREIHARLAGKRSG